jgi:hypothetical protein
VLMSTPARRRCVATTKRMMVKRTGKNPLTYLEKAEIDALQSVCLRNVL